MQTLKRKWFDGNYRIIEMSPCQLKQGLLSYFVVYKTHLNMVWKNVIKIKIMEFFE